MRSLVDDLRRTQYREAEAKRIQEFLTALTGEPWDEAFLRRFVEELMTQSTVQDTSWGRSIRTGPVWLAERLLAALEGLEVWSPEELLYLRLANLRDISRGHVGYYRAVMSDTPGRRDRWVFQLDAAEELEALLADGRPEPAGTEALLRRVEGERTRRGTNFALLVHHIRTAHRISEEAAADLA